jgi:tetratricopeptide (TPR) repeat protein
VSAFEQALKLNARHGPALMGLAEALRLGGNKERAVEYYRQYLEVLPNGVDAAVARNNIERLKK